MSPLRRPLLFRVLLLVLAPLVLLFAFVLWAGTGERRNAATEAKASALRLAKAVAANQDQLIVEAHQLLATLARDPRLEPPDATSCNRYLSEIVQRWPRYANVGVISPDGRLRCSALPGPPRLDLSDRVYFQQALATRAFAVGDYQIGRITGKATLNFGYPLLDSRGRVSAIAFAALDLGWLNALATDANLNAGTAITVVDRNGTIFARYPDSDLWIGRSARKEPAVDAVLQGEEGTAEADGLDGIERFYGFTPLPRSTQTRPVYVTAGVPTESALAPAQRELERNLAAVGLLAVLAALIGWLGGERIVVRPIERRERDLRAQAAAVTQFAERLATADGDGDLGAAVVTGLMEASGADVGALYLAEDEGQGLSLAATRGVDASLLPAHLAPDEGRSGRALVERRALTASDDESSLRLVALGAELRIRHELHLPLVRGDDGVGVVALGRVANGPFASHDLELVERLAGHAATALGLE